MNNFLYNDEPRTGARRKKHSRGRLRHMVFLLALEISCAAFWISASGQTRSPLPMQVGGVNFRLPCTFRFNRRDANWRSNGAIIVRRATVWNTVIPANARSVPVAVVGELPPIPHGVMPPDLTQPMVPYFDPRKCKAVEDGRAECRNVTLMPRAVSARLIKEER